MPKPNLITFRFGKLIVIEQLPERYFGSIAWLCVCDCGRHHQATSYRLTHGRVTSCGCDFSEKQRINIAGQRFGFLTCIKPTGKSRGQNQSAEWECTCDCGGTHTTTIQVLRSQKAIGCLKCRSLRIRDANITHGMARRAEYSAEYSAWQSMIQRTTNPTNPNYSNYGGRGITTSPEWQGETGFQNFFNHLGHRPQGTSLSRINNDKGYYPENVKWDSLKNQARNKRTTRFLTINGVERPMLEWSEISGTKWATINARLKARWSPEDAVFQPLGKGKKLTRRSDSSVDTDVGHAAV